MNVQQIAAYLNRQYSATMNNIADEDIVDGMLEYVQGISYGYMKWMCEITWPNPKPGHFESVRRIIIEDIDKCKEEVNTKAYNWIYRQGMLLGLRDTIFVLGFLEQEP